MEWRAVIGFDGLYEVSDTGVVRRVVSCNTTPAGHVMDQELAYNGYLRLRLWDKTRKHQVKRSVHRVVAEAFLGLCTNGYQVNHKNGVKIDNRAENLEWCTPSQNQQHLCRTLGFRPTIPPPRYGEDNNKTILTEQDVRQIVSLCDEVDRNGYPVRTQRSVAKLFGVSYTAVNCILYGRTWKHLGLATRTPLGGKRYGRPRKTNAVHGF
jgi:hypothetical protein